MAVFQNRLYAGTSNDSGCQVWRAIYRFQVRATVTGGHGSVSPASQMVNLGGEGRIDITPEPGYRIATITDNSCPKAVSNPYYCCNVCEKHNVVVTFELAGYPPTINLSAERKTEQSWIVKKDYGEINITLTEHANDPLPVARYVLYRIQNGSVTQLAEYATAGSHTYLDTYLESGVSYSYRVRALDAAGSVVAQSEIITI
jgi:hypothetical protein